MEGAERLYAALGAKQGICRKTGRTGRGERRAGRGKLRTGREKRRPRRKSRQNRRRPPGPAGGRATGGPEGLKARGQPRRQRRRPPRKPPGRSPRPGEKEPAQTGRGRRGRTPATPQAGAGARTGKRTKTGGGRRRREKTEMRQRTQGERAGPCAWRYSCQVASVNVRARSEHPGPLVEREVGVTRMEPRSQRWLKTSTISRPRRESCSGSLSSRLSSRASISSWTRAAAVLTPHRHSPLAGGQARPQGRVGLAGAAGAYGDDVVTARGEPRETHPLRPLCGPDGPADLPDVPKHREAGKKRVRGSESKTGPSREGTGAAPRAGESPGEKHPLRAPCAGPEAPQTSRTSQTPGGRQKACTRLWERNRDIQTAGAALGKPGDGSGASPRSALFQHGDDGGTGQARRNGAGSRAGCDRVRAGNGRRPRADALRRRPAGRQGRTHGTRDSGETAVNGS